MIGKICSVLLPYFNLNKQANSFKKRPALVLAKADENDYVILPISSVSYRKNIDIEYDILIDPIKYPKLNLVKCSYVRTHKQTVVHRSMICNLIGDIKTDYPDLYEEIITKRDRFSKEITRQALR